MGMLTTAMIWGLCGWLIAIVFVVLNRCLNGGIGLSGMLAENAQAQTDGRPAPERVQLLVMFLIALIGYAQIALRAKVGKEMPAVPPELMVLLAGSHGIYLSGKLTRALLHNKRTAKGRKKESL